MTFALSNRCNLECVMCNGELSSKIRAREGRPPLPPAYGEDFFRQLDEFLPSLQVANFLGGEPFLINENFRIWEQMAAQGLDTLCAVVTNGTRFDDRVQRALDALPFEIVVSLDGVRAETVESIRTNVDHAAVLANAERFRDYARTVGTTFAFNYCLTPANWSELGEFLAFADSWDAEVRVISVTEPGHSLHDLPDDELAGILAELEAESVHREPALGRNRSAWSVEVEQVRRTLAERDRGSGVTIRQPSTVAGPLVAPPAAGPSTGVAERVAWAREQVTRWAHGGPVARLATDGGGSIVELEAPGDTFLGVSTGEAVGLDLDGFVRRTALAGDRRFTVMDRWEGDGTLDVTLLATAGPAVRGAVGSVLRVVSVGRDVGAETFVAADHFYEHRRAG
jgi:molybdenum cofactor biosynthesis enzyme MoaA